MCLPTPPSWPEVLYLLCPKYITETVAANTDWAGSLYPNYNFYKAESTNLLDFNFLLNILQCLYDIDDTCLDAGDSACLFLPVYFIYKYCLCSIQHSTIYS